MDIRYASLVDYFRIFLWRNNEEVRNKMLCSSKITVWRHIHWTLKSLFTRKLFVFVIVGEDREPLGVVSFSKIDSVTFDWSFYLTPSGFGHNVGERMCRKSLLKFGQQFSACRIKTSVKSNNFRSQKIHKKLGFISLATGELVLDIGRLT